jgi:hypothetical protein
MDVLTPNISQCLLQDKMRGHSVRTHILRRYQLERIIQRDKLLKRSLYCLLFVSGTIKSVSSNYGVKCNIAENNLQLFCIIQLNTIEQAICNRS